VICKSLDLRFQGTVLKSQLAIHLTAASLASGPALSRTRAKLAPALPVLRILDKAEAASPIMAAKR
jgi:hypothetical protein